MTRPRVATGCERLLAEAETLRGRRYGLLAHGASITHDARPLHLALAASAAGPPRALFGPEHGYYGVEQDMVASADRRDPWTGAAILSLYGETAETLRPRPEAFASLDLVLIDLQDVGSRYYTYAATAVWTAAEALVAGLEVWVLDRPDPLGGMAVEGNRLRPGFESFVGAFAGLPVRHGLTLGELVLYAGRHWRQKPRILTLEGWRRDMAWRETGLPWIAPSPNMPAPATALVYGGGCLVEATELSEGRGTTRPFQLVGAPGVDPPALVRALDERRLPGVAFLPTYFRPQFQKHAGAVCGGVELVVTDPLLFRSYRTGVELLRSLHDQLGEGFAWREAPYEFESERPAIDLLTGCDDFRRALERGRGVDEWVAGWAAEEDAFREERRDVLLYPEEH
jgi:uncharacterized protein YbbC (DUF1343 family)